MFTVLSMALGHNRQKSTISRYLSLIGTLVLQIYRLKNCQIFYITLDLDNNAMDRNNVFVFAETLVYGSCRARTIKMSSWIEIILSILAKSHYARTELDPSLSLLLMQSTDHSKTCQINRKWILVEWTYGWNWFNIIVFINHYYTNFNKRRSNLWVEF